MISPLPCFAVFCFLKLHHSRFNSFNAGLPLSVEAEKHPAERMKRLQLLEQVDNGQPPTASAYQPHI